MPKGTRYIGTFAVVFSSEKNAGFYRMLKDNRDANAFDPQS
jgi:hypothetical protein